MELGNSTAHKGEWRKLKPPHKQFILMMLARCYRASDIARMLNSIDCAIDYDFPIVTVNKTTVWRAIQKIDSGDVKLVREEFLSTVEDVRLAHKKNRILELQKIVDDKMSSGSDKIHALRAIRAEGGEDIDKIADALRRSGDQHLTFNFGDLSDDDRNRIRREVGTLWSPASNRF